MAGNDGFLSSDEAAVILGVSRQTIYAYVSRGLIRSVPGPGRRDKQYVSEDVYALRERRDAARAEAATPRESLHWGPPVFETEISSIEESHLIYRGRPAVKLARNSRFEAVVRHLWGVTKGDVFRDREDDPVLATLQDLRGALPGDDPINRAVALLLEAQDLDVAAYSNTAESDCSAGVRVLRIVAACLSGGPLCTEEIVRQLTAAWRIESDAGADLLRLALALSAENEANTSTFVVRCIASTRVPLYAAIAGGLCAVRGPGHGGMIDIVDRLVSEIAESDDPERAVVRRLQRGEAFPGFGHPLYPDGDPRARLLIERLTDAYGDDPRVVGLHRAAEAVEAHTGHKPMIYLPLVMIARLLDLPEPGALALFAIGRTAGWLAHAMEQRRSERLIRPRSLYVGPRPTVLR